MASIINVDQIAEATSGSGVHIPGHILQVVHSVISTQASTSSDSFVDSTLTATITPKNSSSLILATGAVSLYNASNASAAAMTVKRGSTNLGQTTWGLGYIYAASAGGHVNYLPINIRDAPATTSATTYTVQYSRTAVAVGSAIICVNGTYSTLTLMEIAQ